MIYVQFSRPNDTIPSTPPLFGPRLGPYGEGGVALTYGSLRDSENSALLAWIEDDVWRVVGDPSETDKDHWYSDVVIYSEDAQ